jgi:hypothetical protein
VWSGRSCPLLLTLILIFIAWTHHKNLSFRREPERQRRRSGGTCFFVFVEIDRVERALLPAAFDFDLELLGAPRLRLRHPCVLCKGGHSEICRRGFARRVSGSHLPKITKGGTLSKFSRRNGAERWVTRQLAIFLSRRVSTR